MRCVSRTSLCQTGVLLTIFTCLVLLPHAGFGQTRTVDVRAYWGTPPGWTTHLPMPGWEAYP